MPRDEVSAAHESLPESPPRVMALVLAAGAATRMGKPKALLPWRDATLIRHVVATTEASGCSETRVVAGAHASEIEQALTGLESEIVVNEDFASGMGASIAAGLAAVPRDIDAVLLLLADQPFVTSGVLDELIRLYIEGRAAGQTLAASHYADTLGPPAIFDRRHFDTLRNLRGDRGAKPLFAEPGSPVPRVEFPEGEFDLDTPDDYSRALEHDARSGT